MPRIDNMLTAMSHSAIFSVIDLSKGFLQIEVAEEDRPKTAFICAHGLWQYKRMPMGMCNSPSTFMRALNELMNEFRGLFVSVYFDDLCIYSKSFEDHMTHIRLVLTKLRDAGFTIHPIKAQLCKTRLRYLGFILEPGKIMPDPDKVEVLKTYPRPRNVKEVQRFIGFVGFYRRFIPDFAKYSKPLTMLIKKGTCFTWDDNAESGF